MTAGKASQPFKVLRMQSPYRLVKVEAGPETENHLDNLPLLRRRSSFTLVLKYFMPREAGRRGGLEKVERSSCVLRFALTRPDANPHSDDGKRHGGCRDPADPVQPPFHDQLSHYPFFAHQ
jgi:hypothetical protein